MNSVGHTMQQAGKSRKIGQEKSLGLSAQGKTPRPLKAGRGTAMRTPTPTALPTATHRRRFVVLTTTGLETLNEVEPGVFAIVESHD